MPVKGRKPFKTKSGRSNYGGNKGDMRKTARRSYSGLKKKLGGKSRKKKK